MRLHSVDVKGMVDQFDHYVEFDSGSNNCIVYGPNGVGKTRLLELIDAVLNLQPGRIAKIPFASSILAFDEGTQVQIKRSLEDVGDGHESRVMLEIELLDGGLFPLIWTIPDITFEANPPFERFLTRETPWRKVGTDLWEDARDGEISDLWTLEQRYPEFTRSRQREMGLAPQPIRDLFERFHSHLIETQRLRTTALIEAGIGRNRAKNRSTVEEYSDDIRKRISQALSENSRTSQQLDRTFPRRVLSNEQGQHFPDVDEIRTKYEEQTSLRNRLARIAVIGIEADLPLPDRDLESWERKVLWLYLKDADLKLQSFRNLLQKVELFEEIVNKRFSGKRVRVDAQEGLGIETDSGLRRVPLESLSSGEQHELILMYDLLFNVQPGSIVLIDEPEISLHVSWQLPFMSDVEQISRLSDFQFIVATHSPQIINDRWENAIRLGPGVGAFE